MRQLSILAMLVFVFTTSVWAQKIRVEKVKGNKAVVDFSGASPVVGQVYDLDARPTTRAAYLRDNVLGVAMSLTSLTLTVSGSSSTRSEYSITGKYGWNKGQTEFGFLAEVGSIDSGSSATRTLGAGGFFDFNFQPNRVGIDQIFGIGAQGEIGNKSSTSTSYMFWVVRPSGFVKLFVARGSTCLRGDLGYYYRNDASTSALTTAGLMGTLEISHYF